MVEMWICEYWARVGWVRVSFVGCCFDGGLPVGEVGGLCCRRWCVRGTWMMCDKLLICVAVHAVHPLHTTGSLI